MRHGLCVYCDNSSQIGQTVTHIDLVFSFSFETSANS